MLALDKAQLVVFVLFCFIGEEVASGLGGMSYVRWKLLIYIRRVGK